MSAFKHRYSCYACVCAFLFALSCKQSSVAADPFETASQQLIAYNLDAAEAAAKQGWLDNPNSEAGWKCKLKYAEILLFKNRLADAADALKAPLSTQSQTLNSRYHFLVACLAFYKHDPAAEQAMRAAIAEAHAASDAESEAEGLMRLQSYHKTGATPEQEILKQAAEVSHSNHLDYQEARALNQLGNLALHQNRYADAIPYLRQAIAEAKHINATYVEAAATQNLGECYFQLGDFGRALDPLLAAEKLLPANDYSVVAVNTKNDLGGYYAIRQQNEQALRYFREAFALAQHAPVTSARYILSSLNLATGLVQTQNPDEAEKYNELAGDAARKAHDANINIDREWIAAIQTNRADIAAQRGRFSDAEKSYRGALDDLKGEPPNQTQVLAYAGLAEAEEHLHRTNEARANFENALLSIEANRGRQASAQYQIKFLSALIRFYEQYEQFLMRQNEPWKALAVADSSRAGVLTQRLSSSRRQRGFEDRILARARETSTAFLFYSVSPAKSYLWAITPSGREFHELALSGRQIERDVTSYSALIQNYKDTLAESNPTGLRLYQNLIAPVASHLHAGVRVVIVPDGILHALNFETLLAPGEKPHYWLQDVSLTVAPCLRVFLDRPERRETAARALVIGDPVYLGTDYSLLPESKKEVAQVSRRFPAGLAVLTEQKAAPDNYQKTRPELFSLIHFSAHVDSDAQSPLESAIILSPGEDGSRKLYARDFRNLNADLVTVSGCSSVGKTPLSGEGMVGFAWAAFDAGARNALTSLWAVDDLSTAELMDRFYAGVTAGKPFATALHDAKLDLLKTNFKKPVYWAAFQLYSRNIGDATRLPIH